MPKEIGFDEARSLIEGGAQLVEVLPAREYEEEHLPGAISIPLKTLTPAVATQLDPTRAVVLYCWDDA
jgi:rhodanese-related sulfurtransferase